MVPITVSGVYGWRSLLPAFCSFRDLAVPFSPPIASGKVPLYLLPFQCLNRVLLPRLAGLGHPPMNNLPCSPRKSGLPLAGPLKTKCRFVLCSSALHFPLSGCPIPPPLYFVPFFPVVDPKPPQFGALQNNFAVDPLSSPFSPLHVPP